MLGTGGGSWLVDIPRISSPAFSHSLPCCTRAETKSQLRSGPRNPCMLLEATLLLCASNSIWNTLGPFSSLQPCLG